jgi:hypothetical protein
MARESSPAERGLSRRPAAERSERGAEGGGLRAGAGTGGGGAPRGGGPRGGGGGNGGCRWPTNRDRWLLILQMFQMSCIHRGEVS